MLQAEMAAAVAVAVAVAAAAAVAVGRTDTMNGAGLDTHLHLAIHTKSPIDPCAILVLCTARCLSRRSLGPLHCTIHHFQSAQLLVFDADFLVLNAKFTRPPCDRREIHAF